MTRGTIDRQAARRAATACPVPATARFGHPPERVLPAPAAGPAAPERPSAGPKVAVRAVRLAGAAALTLAAAACQSDDNLFTGPKLTPVGVGLTVERAPVPTSFVPAGPTSFGSLFGTRSRDLVIDNRAMDIGDTLTIDITFDDLANFSAETERARGSDIAFDIFGFVRGQGFRGAESEARGASGFGVGNESDFASEGEIDRRERLRLRLAAVVTDILPNGNLFISGTQEIRVTNEVRVLNIAGIVDPLDISRQNVVPYTKIAEARISYGGRGRSTDVQTPGWGQLVYDRFGPF